MSKRWVVAILLAVFAVQGAAFAHDGHTHKALGTIADVRENRLEIKTTDGRVVIVLVDQKTVITRGKEKLDVTALRTGERVAIDYLQEENANTAKTVRLGAAPASATK